MAAAVDEGGRSESSASFLQTVEGNDVGTHVRSTGKNWVNPIDLMTFDSLLKFSNHKWSNSKNCWYTRIMKKIFTKIAGLNHP